MKHHSPKLRIRTALFKGGFVHNPVLTQIIGICPIVMAATSLRNALLISLFLTFILVLCESFTSLFLKDTMRYVRLCFYTVISALSVVFGDILLSRIYPDFSLGLGIYLYLLTANALTVIRCEKFACKTTVRNSIVDALASGIGYGIVTVIVGAVREFINYGTVLNETGADRFPVVNSPFFALIILGFLSAIHRYIVIRFYPNELADTFFMNEVWEKVSIKDPGLSRKKEKKPSFSEDSLDSIRPRHSLSEQEENQ